MSKCWYVNKIERERLQSDLMLSCERCRRYLRLHTKCASERESSIVNALDMLSFAKTNE